MQVIHCTQQQITEHQINTLVDLFNAYRVFYEQPSDLGTARSFIEKNLQQNRSQIFLLLDDENKPLGFSQLYPAVCSVSLRDYYYLSDLYIVPNARRSGHARYLMTYLTQRFTQQGAQRLTLDTASTNTSAQSLYESLGYVREDTYITYHQILPTANAR